MKFGTTLCIGACAVLPMLLGGCALNVEQVRPWEMDRLARSEMALEVDPLMAGYRRHAQFSKEAATGGASVSGGGCGCN